MTINSIPAPISVDKTKCNELHLVPVKIPAIPVRTGWNLRSTCSGTGL
jgi:hypothetical protein